MTFDIKIVCTDRGQHGPAELATLRVREDKTFELAATRLAAAPWADVPGAQIAAEGITVPAPKQVLKKTDDRRDNYGGRRRWRFSCARCGRDMPVNEPTMTKIVDAKVAIGEGIVDFSFLP